MSNITITQEQADRLTAFETMLDMMDPDAGYTKGEIEATITQLVEMAVEDREAEQEEAHYADRYPGQPTAQLSTRELLEEATRLEQLDELDRIDAIRYDFVKRELNKRF